MFLNSNDEKPWSRLGNEMNRIDNHRAQAISFRSNNSYQFLEIVTVV